MAFVALNVAVADSGAVVNRGRPPHNWSMATCVRQAATCSASYSSHCRPCSVRQAASYGPALIPLPHPSWRSRGWMKRNPWFEAEILPELRARIAALVDSKKEHR